MNQMMAGTYEVWNQRVLEDQMLEERRIALVQTALSYLTREQQVSLENYLLRDRDTDDGFDAYRRFCGALGDLKRKTGETIY